MAKEEGRWVVQEHKIVREVLQLQVSGRFVIRS